jgi:hypothetical protein
MVGGVVDRVDTDCVEAQALELLDVTLATISISDRVPSVGSTACRDVSVARAGGMVVIPG